MTPLPIRVAAILALTVLVVAVLMRRRSHPSFAVYLVVVWIGESLVFLWPGRFFRFDFWAQQQLVYGVLRLAVAVDIAAVVFRAFPRPSRAWLALVVVAAAIGAAGFEQPVCDGCADGAGEYLLFFRQVGPRMSVLTMWAFALLAALALLHAVPLLSWERSILIGFVLYQPVLAAALAMAEQWTTTETAGLISAVAWIAVCVWWTRGALAVRSELPSIEGSRSAIAAVRAELELLGALMRALVGRARRGGALATMLAPVASFRRARLEAAAALLRSSHNDTEIIWTRDWHAEQDRASARVLRGVRTGRAADVEAGARAWAASDEELARQLRLLAAMERAPKKI